MGQQACYRDRLLSAQISINLARQYLADAARRGYFCACTVHKRLILLVLKRSNLVEVVDKRRFVLVGLAEAAGKVHLPFSDAVRNAVPDLPVLGAFKTIEKYFHQWPDTVPVQSPSCAQGHSNLQLVRCLSGSDFDTRTREHLRACTCTAFRSVSITACADVSAD